MPDDSDKSIIIPESPTGNNDMGLNSGLWSPASGGMSAPPLPPAIESDCANERNSDSASPLQSSSLSITNDVKIEPPPSESNDKATTSTWIANSFGSSAASRVPFTKREKEFLCCLIQKHVYLKMGHSQSNLPTLGAFSQKNTLSSFCRVPNTAWKAIANEYNSKDNVRQRSIKQLRKCWENLKHRGNIDPAALYSGKKLQGKTSMSGAFTLTTESEENGAMKISQPKNGESFIEISMEEDEASGGIERATDLTSQARENLPTDLSIRGRRSAETPTTSVEVDKFQATYTCSPSPQQQAITEGSVSPTARRPPPAIVSASLSPHVLPRLPFSARSADNTPKITNIRTVRSLKPSWSQPMRRRFGTDLGKEKPGNSRMLSNFATNQKLQDMKVKLLAARIKEHESNIQRVKLQMEHAQAQHDVHMRLLRTKAAWYDAHLRKLEKQLGSGDVSLVGEEEDGYHCDNPDEIAMQYEQDYDDYN